MKPRVWAIFIAIGMLLGEVDTVLAWGPGTHIALSGSILERLHLLPAAIGALLARHGIAYLYGSIAADMVFAKRLSRVKQFCHHWSTGFGLLDAARTDRDRSFAYGYLSHLAADTVAHGKFVPRQIVVSNYAVGLGHLYWELRADSMQISLRICWLLTAFVKTALGQCITCLVIYEIVDLLPHRNHRHRTPLPRRLRVMTFIYGMFAAWHWARERVVLPARGYSLNGLASATVTTH